MSHITQCPACATMFKVVADQLRISQGWVRCGQCDEVFDANAHMRNLPQVPPDARLATPPAPDPAPAPTPTPTPTPAPRTPPTEYDWTGIVEVMKDLEQPVVTDGKSPLTQAQAQPQARPSAQPEAVPEAANAWVQQVQAIAQSEPLPAPASVPAPASDLQVINAFTFTAGFDPANDPASEVESSSVATLVIMPGLASTPTYERSRPRVVLMPEPVRASTPVQPEPDQPKPDAAELPRPDELVQRWSAAESATEPSFMAARPTREVKAPKPVPRWQRGLALTAWWCAAVGLTLSLALQVVLHQRDWLAAYQPALKPVLQSICSTFSCKLSPLQRIEAVVIENSVFSRVSADVYKLSITLKNNAPLTIAKPWLELTLTDAQDQAVLRKVLSPAAFGDTTDVLTATNEFAGVLAISATPPQGSAPIVGYRVLAFYP